MAGKTVTRAQLGEAVYQEVGLSRNESDELVEAVLSEISDALTRGETVKISSFGSFSVRQKGQRIGRNPKTGEEVPILPRKVLVFRASHVLKGRVDNASQRAAEDDLRGAESDNIPESAAAPHGSGPGPERGGEGERF